MKIIIILKISNGIYSRLVKAHTFDRTSSINDRIAACAMPDNPCIRCDLNNGRYIYIYTVKKIKGLAPCSHADSGIHMSLMCMKVQDYH